MGQFKSLQSEILMSENGLKLGTWILKIFLGGILSRDLFPSGIIDCTKQTNDSNWLLCTESPINMRRFPLKICNNFNASNLKNQTTQLTPLSFFFLFQKPNYNLHMTLQFWCMERPASSVPEVSFNEITALIGI